MSNPAALPVLLSLVDQRLPSGGHIHSGGIEEAVTDGTVHDTGSLGVFLSMRLQCIGLVSASIAAAAFSLTAGSHDRLEAETEARLPSPIARATSRAQGRGLLRVARAAWAAPSAELSWRDVGERPHLPILMGCIARAAGLTPFDAALATAYQCVTGPATAKLITTASSFTYFSFLTVFSVLIPLRVVFHSWRRGARRGSPFLRLMLHCPLIGLLPVLIQHISTLCL